MWAVDLVLDSTPLGMEKVKRIEVGTCLLKPNIRSDVRAEIECRTNNEHGEIVLIKKICDVRMGEADDELWEKIELCLMSMKKGEKCEFIFHKEEVQCWCRIQLISFVRATDSWKFGSQEKIDIALHHKKQGNELFKSDNIISAACRYSKALKYLISINPDVSKADSVKIKELKVLCLLNMAACQLKLEHFDHVLKTCTKVLDIETSNSKAYYRRGMAYLKMKEFDLAESDLLKAKQLEPISKVIEEQLRVLQTQKQSNDQILQTAMKKMFGSGANNN